GAVLSARHCSTGTATTEVYPVSLHDALPIYDGQWRFDLTTSVLTPPNDAPFFTSTPDVEAEVDVLHSETVTADDANGDPVTFELDWKSTRLNSSHVKTSYADFCLNKKRL